MDLLQLQHLIKYLKKKWNYSMDLYEQNLSDVTLNKRRLKQLDQIFIEELQEIKEDMKYQKKAAYQEIMLENYILQ
jgi:hypothetical protein|nr:MAG TPA: hypothetical protein [Caudoviricetes sp.]